MRRVELRIGVLLPSGNTWERLHWAGKARFKSRLASEIRAACFELRIPVGQPMRRARIEVVRHSSTQPDGDNATYSLKPLLDVLRDYAHHEKVALVCGMGKRGKHAMTRLGLIADDSPACIGQPVVRWSKAPRGKGGTTIIIEEQAS